MRLYIRSRIENSFLYKRFAYNSDGFIALMKFLEDENLIDKFYELKDNRKISLEDFFGYSRYSFSFMESKFGEDFWFEKIFGNENFRKISDKIL